LRHWVALHAFKANILYFIDTMEEVAKRLGLEAEQVMVLLDHLLEAEAKCLPAIVVVRQPGGLTHFVVAWRRHGGLLQVMDPATGRRWPGLREFLDSVYPHRMPVSASGWREWAGSDEFQAPLRARLGGLGISGGEAGGEASALLGEALADHGWRSLAALDAGVRMTRSLVVAARQPALRRGGRPLAADRPGHPPGGPGRGAAQASPFVRGTASAGSLAVTLGGSLFAWWAFWKMVRGIGDLAEAAVAWRQVAPIFSRRRPPRGRGPGSRAPVRRSCFWR
jgi:hypothetical protein